MNNKIFKLIEENLKDSFSLPKYKSISIDQRTRVDYLPWTPARFEKFKNKIDSVLDLDCSFVGTVEEIVDNLDKKYMSRFFGQIWKPNTDCYSYSGWNLIDTINKDQPADVLDVGCGFNQFKNRIHNLVGVDPYNNCADYMVDILEYVPDVAGYDAILALGSINFNSEEDVTVRFKKVTDMLNPGGEMYVRANPGESWENGPYVDIFKWDFEFSQTIAKNNKLKLDAYKKDANNRLFLVYTKI